MIKIILTVDSDNIIGIKETLAEYLEKYGDTQVIEVSQIAEQTRLTT